MKFTLTHKNFIKIIEADSMEMNKNIGSAVFSIQDQVTCICPEDALIEMEFVQKEVNEDGE